MQTRRPHYTISLRKPELPEPQGQGDDQEPKKSLFLLLFVGVPKSMSWGHDAHPSPARAPVRQQTTLLLNEQQSDAMRFTEADVNGDQRLDFDEWLALMPPRLRREFGTEDLRSWFDAADLDKNGTLSIDEFFLWSLNNGVECMSATSAGPRSGADLLLRLFAHYDSNKSGEIDVDEFHQACEDTGFGPVSHAIFRTLDKDGSGTISYRELVQALSDGMPTDTRIKHVLGTIILSYANEVKAERQRATEVTWRKPLIGVQSRRHGRKHPRRSVQHTSPTARCISATLPAPSARQNRAALN